MERNQLSRSRREITHPTAVKWLMNWRKRRFLEPFMRRPMSVREAAETVEAKHGTLRYHVEQFVKFGLLEAAGSVKLEGRTVKTYRPTAGEFFVPFALLLYPIRNEIIEHVTTVKTLPIYASNLPEAQSDLWGVLIKIGRSDRGIPFELELMPADLQRAYAREPWKALEPPPGLSAICSSEMLIRLDDEAAEAFQRELIALTQRFKQQQSESGKPYHIALAMTPAARG
jgi:hypothetical protein